MGWVPFAHDGSRVSRLLKLVSDSRFVEGKASRRAVAKHTGATHPRVLTTRHESGARAGAHGTSTVPRVQDLATVRQGINVRSVRCRMASKSEVSVSPAAVMRDDTLSPCSSTRNTSTDSQIVYE